MQQFTNDCIVTTAPKKSHRAIMHYCARYSIPISNNILVTVSYRLYPNKSLIHLF